MGQDNEGFGTKLRKALLWDPKRGEETSDLPNSTPTPVPSSTARPPAVNLGTLRARRSGVTPRSASAPSAAPTVSSAAAPHTEEVDVQYLEQIMVELANAPLPDGFADFVQLFVTLRKKSGSKQSVEESFDLAFTTVNGTKGLTLEQISGVLKTQQKLLDGIQNQFVSDITADAREKKAGFQQTLTQLDESIAEATESLRELEDQYLKKKGELETARHTAETQREHIVAGAESIDANVEAEKRAFGSAYTAALNGHPTSGWVGLVPLQTLIQKMKP